MAKEHPRIGGDPDFALVDQLAEIQPRFESLGRRFPHLRLTLTLALNRDTHPEIDGDQLFETFICEKDKRLFFRAIVTPAESVSSELADACRIGGSLLRAFDVPRRAGKLFIPWPLTHDEFRKVIDDERVKWNWFPLSNEWVWTILLFRISNMLAPSSIIEQGMQDHGDDRGSYRKDGPRGDRKKIWSLYELHTPICEASRYACKWGPSLMEKYGILQELVSKDDLRVDTLSCQVLWNGKRLPINVHADFLAFAALHEAAGGIVPFEDILRRIKLGEKIIKMHSAPPEVQEAIKHIKSAFRKRQCTWRIESARKKGYRLVPPDE